MSCRSTHARTHRHTNLNSRHFKSVIGIFHSSTIYQSSKHLNIFNIRIKRARSTKRDTCDRGAEAASLTRSLNKSNFVSTSDKSTLASCRVSINLPFITCCTQTSTATHGHACTHSQTYRSHSKT